MEEMVKYIFNNMKITEQNVNDIFKVLKKQKKRINKLTLFSLGISAYLLFIDKQNKEDKEKMNKKIDSLTASVERMKMELLAFKIEKGEPKM